MAGWAAVCEEAALLGWASVVEEDVSDGVIGQDDPAAALPMMPAAGAVGCRGAGGGAAPLQPQVSTETLQALWPPTPSIWQPAHLQQTLTAVLEACRQTPSPSLDTSIAPLADFFVQLPSRLHGSKAAITQLLGIEAKKIEPNLMALADAMLQLDHSKRENLERLVSQSGAQLLLYSDVVRYDETPMKVGQRQSLQDLGVPLDDAAPAGQMPSQLLRHSDLQGETIGRTSTPAKLLATEAKYVMLVKLPADGAPGQAGQYVHLMGSSLTSLQVVEHTTGPVLKTSLLENNYVSKHSEGFQMKVRMATTDMHPGNVAAERLLMMARPGWSHLHFGCNVHVAARAHSKTFSLVPNEISGLLNFALSLSQGTALVQFRKALVKVLGSKLRFLYGKADEQANQYRCWVLDVFARKAPRRK